MDGSEQTSEWMGEVKVWIGEVEGWDGWARSKLGWVVGVKRLDGRG